jgi:asparagine synthase (glutamine-hydrolysing)
MPCYLPISPHAALAELQKLIYDFEEIYIGLPTPAWMIYRELRRSGVTVSLDGHGADELLGGYPHLVQAALDASGGVLRAPGRALDLMHTQRQLHTGNAAVHLPSYFRMAVASDPLLRTAYPHLMQLKRRLSGMRRGRTTPEGAAAGASSWVIAPPAVDLFSLDADVATRHLGKLNATLYREFHSTVLPTILRNFDRCSMAHGIEIRMPFMDWRLVCFCFSLPETSKIGGGFTKRILRESMRGVMPEDLRLRKGKIGFNSPLPEWFNGPLREWVTAQVHDRDFLQSNLWNGPAICRYVEDRQHAGAWMWDECQRVWPFLHAHAWRRTFLARSEVQ